jgi:hypothetical protein
LSVLKPILKWEKKVALFSKLHTRYCDLYMDLKYLTEDMTAEQDVSGKTDSKFTAIRKRFKTLQKDEPPHDKGEIERFQERAIEEIDIRKCWLPPANGAAHAQVPSEPQTAKPSGA